jgi:hypothetical protein
MKLARPIMTNQTSGAAQEAILLGRERQERARNPQASTFQHPEQLQEPGFKSRSILEQFLRSFYRGQ